MKLDLPARYSVTQVWGERRTALGPFLASLSMLVVIGCAGGGSGVQPGLAVSPSIMSAGNVALGGSKTQVVILTNISKTSLTIKGANLTGNGFKVLGLPLPLNLTSGQSFDFDLQFTPTSVGSMTGSLSLASSAPPSPVNIALSGTGVTNAAPVVSISVAPTSANVPADTSPQFTAIVSGSSNTGVTWTVNGVVGGSSTRGSISSTGNYTAPASLPSPATVTVTATSSASSSAKASSTVTLTNPTPPVTGTVLNVLDFGATVNTGVDATAAINRTIAALPASGGTVYLPPGTYALKSNTTAIELKHSHLHFLCDTGAVLQAQTGYVAGAPIIDILSSSTDISVQACILDGNNIAGNGVRVDEAAASINIDHIECKKSTSQCVYGLLRTGGLLQVTNSSFHNVPTGFYDFVGSSGTPSARLDNNTFDTITGNPNGIGAGSSGLNYFEASGNLFTNIITGTQQALYCYGCDKVDWQHNRFDNVFGAIHCDTCGGGIISFNTANNSRGGADFFPEVGSNFTLEGNTSTNAAGERGMVLGVGSSTQGVDSLRTQVASFDSMAGFTAGSGVSLATDSADKKEGSGSMVATATANFTTGALWYFDFGTPQIFWTPYQDIWIKSTSGALPAGQLQLCMSVHTAISTCDLPVDLPAVAQNTWNRVIAYATGWEAAVSINGQSRPGFNSFGIRVTRSSPSLVVKFDDFDRASELLGYVARSNKVVTPGGSCISFGALQGGIVVDNSCENPGSRSNIAYNDENSAGVTFTNNKSSFSTGTLGTIHLLVDASSSAANLTASGDVTNAATMFSCTNGGVVYPGP